MFRNYDVALEQPAEAEPTPVLENQSNKFLEDMLEAIDAEEVQELGLDPDKPLTHVINRDQAEYFTRLWKRALHDQEQINETANRYLEQQKSKIEAYRAREIGKLDHVINYCSQILRTYAETEMAKTKKKTVSLIEGSLSFRKQPDSYSYDDEKLKKMLSNMADGSKYLKPQEPKVDHASLKKAGQVMNGKFYLDGKLVEGVLITQKQDLFTVK